MHRRPTWKKRPCANGFANEIGLDGRDAAYDRRRPRTRRLVSKTHQSSETQQDVRRWLIARACRRRHQRPLWSPAPYHRRNPRPALRHLTWSLLMLRHLPPLFRPPAEGELMSGTPAVPGGNPGDVAAMAHVATIPRRPASTSSPGRRAVAIRRRVRPQAGPAQSASGQGEAGAELRLPGRRLAGGRRWRRRGRGLRRRRPGRAGPGARAA